MAIKKVYELSVDMKRTSVRVNVPVLVQGDSAEFRIRLADNGVALSTEELGGITSVTMQSGFDAQTIIETIGTLEGSTAVFRLQKGELFRSGTVQAMVQLADADDRISTLRFEYQVIPELSGNYIPGEQDITVFQRYMNDAQAKIDEMASTDVSQLTAQLAQKVGGEVKLKPEEFSDEALALVTGNGTVNLLSIPQDKSVTPAKTNFFKLSRNLFDKLKVVEGHVNEVTGNIDTSTNYFTSDYIGVTGGNSYTITRGYKYAWYDENNVYLAGGNLVGGQSPTIAAPSGAKYLRVGIHKVNAPIDSYMVMEGSSLPENYEAFGADIIPKERQEKQTGLARNNFGVEFLLNNDLPSATDLNTVFADGNHTGIANGNYTNLPPGFNTSKAFKLTVSAMFKGGNRWATQEFTQFDDLTYRWGRVVDKTGALINEWRNLGSVSTGGTQAKPLTGKTLVYFGDSTTEFGTIPNSVADVTGATVQKCGFGGTRLAFHTSSQYDPFSFSKIADAIVSGDFSEQQAGVDNTSYSYSSAFKSAFELLKTIDFNAVDGIVLGYGTNDYMGTSSGSVPLGQSGDSTKDTFYGAINYSIGKILTAYPHLKIAFVTPTWRENSPALGGGEVDTSPNSSGTYLIEYVDALKEEVSEKNHIPVFDLFRKSGFNKYNKSIYLTDSVHPTSAGYTHLGKIIGAFISRVFS